MVTLLLTWTNKQSLAPLACKQNRIKLNLVRIADYLSRALWNFHGAQKNKQKKNTHLQFNKTDKYLTTILTAKHTNTCICHFQESSIHSSLSKRKRVIATARIQPVLQFLELYLLLNCSQQKTTGQRHTWHKAQRSACPNYSWRENNRPSAEKQIESLK